MLRAKLHIIIGLTSVMLCLPTLLRASAPASPWTFWYWMYGAVSKAGIKADLQAMKDVGLGGCYLMPIRGTGERPEYGGEAQQLSPRFWEMADYAMQQCDSLGLQMGIHVCDGFALAGGPWISPEESMQRIVYSDTVVTGGFRHLLMPVPQHYGDYYEDIAVYAIPVGAKSEGLRVKSEELSPEMTVNDKGVYCADKPCWIQYEFESQTVVRSIEIEPSGTNIQCQRLKVMASDDGVNFRTVKQLTPPRQGWQNTGFNTTFSIPPTAARFFRFAWTPDGTEPGAEDLDAAKWKPVLRLKSVRFNAWPLIDNWEGKAGYVWRSAPETSTEDVAPTEYLRPEDIVCATMIGNMLEIDLPKGTWRILRMGHTSTGHTNATAGGAKGLECDKFSAYAVKKQVSSWFGAFMKRQHSSVVKYMHVDSWECGSQNWSRNFADEFRRRRGYDLMPLLPVMAGVPMVNAEQVLRDVRQTIDELKNDVFFATVASCAREYGVSLSAESVAPTMMSDGMSHYRYVDMPMGEFWLNSPTHDKPNDMLDAISAAHVYGKPIVQAEGFTEVRGVWDETPAKVKPLLDRNFALGMNRLFFHVFTHNPWTDRKPGMTLDGIGLFFQRDQTWFAESKSFVDYITRCQTLLQRGEPVVDIAVYTGEELPRRAYTPDRLVSMLPGLFGQERVASEQRRLANEGCPMEESPVGVRHSAGIIDLKDWVNPLHGYLYDSMNKDALLSLPFKYKVLVVPQGIKLSAEARARVDELRRQGVTVIDQAYDKQQIEGVAPDVLLPDGIAFTHRRTSQEDVYFLSNQTGTTVTFLPVFRAECLQPQIYRPIDDSTAPYDGGTVTMLPGEAFFIIFDKQTEPCPQPVASCLHQRVPDYKLKYKMKKGWNVTFCESHFAMRTDSLFDWSLSANETVRYYSGHANYCTTFTYKGNSPVMLSLGKVCDIASVRVNGIDCGTVWMPPYEVDITSALKKGNNTLEVTVVNTWHNALRGADAGKPPYQGIWTNAKYRTKGEELLPAGLLGPVTLRIK